MKSEQKVKKAEKNYQAGNFTDMMTSTILTRISTSDPDRTIDIEPEFLSQYETLPKAIKKKFKKQLTYLKDNPKHRSLQIHKMEGTDYWEFMWTKAIGAFSKEKAI